MTEPVTHFDIPLTDPAAYELEIGGLVRKPSRLTLDEIRARPSITVRVAMECGGNGRALLSRRPISAP